MSTAIAQSTFPAVGDTQCFMGRENGIYRTWMVHGTVKGRVHTHADKTDALQAHDDNIELLKYKSRGKI